MIIDCDCHCPWSVQVQSLWSDNVARLVDLNSQVNKSSFESEKLFLLRISYKYMCENISY